MSQLSLKISPLQRAMYRLRRRFAVSDFSLWMGCPLEDLCKSGPGDDDGFKFIQLKAGETGCLTACNAHFDHRAFQSLDPGRFNCFAYETGGQAVAYAWVGTGDIPAEYGANGHYWTGIPIHISPDCVYLFAAYVKPEFRGRRLYQRLLGRIAGELLERGVRRLILATDYDNAQALKAVERMGFEYYGKTTFCRYKRFGRANYDMVEKFAPNRVGFYLGDKAAARTRAK